MAETPNTFPPLNALGLGAGFAGPLGALMGMGSLFEGISGMFAAKDEAKRKEELFQATKEALLDAHEQEGAQERVGTMQERAQVAEEMKNVSIQGITARGQAGAGAGGANLNMSGSVIESQLDSVVVEDGQKGRIRTLQEFRETAAALRLKSLSNRTRQQILAALPTPTAQPNPLSIGLGAVAGGLEGFAMGKELDLGF